MTPGASLVIDEAHAKYIAAQFLSMQGFEIMKEVALQKSDFWVVAVTTGHDILDTKYVKIDGITGKIITHA